MKASTTLDSILKPIAALILLVPFVGAILAALYVWYGFALSILWGWFMVPGFGAPALSIPMSIGVALTVGMARGYSSRTKDEDKWRVWLMPFIQPGMALLAGWIVKQFI